MSKKTKRAFWPPFWWRKHQRKRELRDKVRARDGDRCWRCNHPMRFDGLPNRGKAATIEHVLPLSKGGSWEIENLRRLARRVRCCMI